MFLPLLVFSSFISATTFASDDPYAKAARDFAKQSGLKSSDIQQVIDATLKFHQANPNVSADQVKIELAPVQAGDFKENEFEKDVKKALKGRGVSIINWKTFGTRTIPPLPKDDRKNGVVNGADQAIKKLDGDARSYLASGRIPNELVITVPISMPSSEERKEIDQIVADISEYAKSKKGLTDSQIKVKMDPNTNTIDCHFSFEQEASAINSKYSYQEIRVSKSSSQTAQKTLPTPTPTPVKVTARPTPTPTPVPASLVMNRPSTQINVNLPQRPLLTKKGSSETFATTRPFVLTRPSSQSLTALRPFTTQRTSSSATTSLRSFVTKNHKSELSFSDIKAFAINYPKTEGEIYQGAPMSFVINHPSSETETEALAETSVVDVEPSPTPEPSPSPEPSPTPEIKSSPVPTTTTPSTVTHTSSGGDETYHKPKKRNRFRVMRWLQKTFHSKHRTRFGRFLKKCPTF